MSKTILCIEDDEDNALLIQVLGEGAGYKILLAYTGQDGIDIAKDQQPDLIVCDYHLPYMNGHEVVRTLRADDSTAHIPIMILTADIYALPGSEELGVDDHLTKPIRRNMFLNRVEKLLRPAER